MRHLPLLANMGSITYCLWGPGTMPIWGRPIAAPLERCAELLGVDLATIREAAANVEPYVRSDGTNVWSLMLPERQLQPEAYGRRRGGYLDADAPQPPTHRNRDGPVRRTIVPARATASFSAIPG